MGVTENPFGPAPPYDPDTDLEALAAQVVARLKKAQTASTQEKRRQLEISAAYVLVQARKLVLDSSWETSLGLPPAEIVRLVELIAPPFVPKPKMVRQWDEWRERYEQKRRETAEARAAAVFVVTPGVPEENDRRFTQASWTRTPKTGTHWLEVELPSGEHCTIQVLARGNDWKLRLIPPQARGGFNASETTAKTYPTAQAAQADALNFIRWFFTPRNEATNEKTQALPPQTFNFTVE